jgi:glycosyltransferase involved in cell wall biosynthesis
MSGYLGYVDEIISGIVYGWAKDPLGGEPLTVQLVIDDFVVAESVAREFREDLAAAEIGTGCHGFGLKIPVLFADGEEHRFDVVVKDDGSAVPNPTSVFRLARAPAPPTATKETVVAPAIKVTPRLSVIMPTFNRGAVMESTVGRFLACATKVNGEIVIVDDGSTDDTPERLRRIAARASNVVIERVPNGGPGTARNVGASLARGDLLVFVGDDVAPIDSDFLLVHSAAHHRYKKRGEAVLGKICWPNMDQLDVNFVMHHIQGDGEQQFGYRNMTPYSWYPWPFFYSSNVSVQKNLVDDWLKDGYHEKFYLAAFEDPEFALRMTERLAKEGEEFKIFYLPTACLAHHHPYTVETFIRRQVSTGLMAHEFLKLHPRRASELGLDQLRARLDTPLEERLFPVEHYFAIFEGLKSWASVLESHYGLGTENWHGDLLRAIFLLAYHEGYIRAQTNASVNVPSACRYVLERVRVSLNRAIAAEALGALPGFGLV